MKYIDLINGFWLIDEQKEFTPNETRLYFFLLHLANRFFWKMEWFEYGDEKMQATVGISAGVLRTARKNLKEASLIDFVAGGQGYRIKTRYRILIPNPEPFSEANPNPNPKAIPYSNKIKTNTKINTNKILSNERFSKREYVACGSDFD